MGVVEFYLSKSSALSVSVHAGTQIRIIIRRIILVFLFYEIKICDWYDIVTTAIESRMYLPVLDFACDASLFSKKAIEKKY